MKITLITQTIETNNYFLLKCLLDVEFSNYIDFNIGLQDLTLEDIELSFEDVYLLIQSINKERLAKSQLIEVSLGLTNPNSKLTTLTIE